MKHTRVVDEESSGEENLDPHATDERTVTRRLKRAKKTIQGLTAEMNGIVADLDDRMNSVLKRHEADYLKGYSIFVREKETELRELIQKLNNRNSDSTLKDEIIFGLKKQIANQFTQMSQMQLDLTDSKQKLKAAQVQIEDLEKERDFLHSQIMESKRHNKLLKLAIQRL
jgi:uncharacterized protein (DUF3084 family)